MSAETITGLALAAFFVFFLLWDALTDDAPPPRSNWERPKDVPEPAWTHVVPEDPPPMPYAYVEWDEVTGEVVEPEPHRIEPNIRRIGAGR